MRKTSFTLSKIFATLSNFLTTLSKNFGTLSNFFGTLSKKIPTLSKIKFHVSFIKYRYNRSYKDFCIENRCETYKFLCFSKKFW